MFPGNTADVSTVEQIKQDLRGWNFDRALFVADSGMNSEDNRKELAKACGTYLLATRMASVGVAKETVLSHPGRYRKLTDNLHAKEVRLENGKRYIVCFNPVIGRRSSACWRKSWKNTRTRAPPGNGLLPCWPRNDTNAIWPSMKKARSGLPVPAVKEAARYDGRWVLETNDTNISLEDSAHGYRGLMVIERCFRLLKRTRIKMMPMYHWLPRRIESHIKICVLALLVERLAEIRCGMSWSRIRAVLSKIQAMEFAAPSQVF